MQFKNGIFFDNDQPIVPIGFNYWPSTTGTGCWTEEGWDLEKMISDLEAIKEHGFNTIRFFLRWPEFQPEIDSINQSAFGKLEQFVNQADELGIWLHPGLFVGFMSGGLYVPDWVGGYRQQGKWWRGRNVFTDPEIIDAELKLVKRAVQVFKGVKHFLAYDLGNEINVWQHSFPDCSPLELQEWQEKLVDCIKAEHPECLVVNGTQMDTVINDCSWPLDRQPTDFNSIHGYPVSNWNHVKFKCLKDVEATMVVPSYVAMGKAWKKPVMLHEYGLALPIDGPVGAGYYRTVPVSAMLQGANGYLDWSWQDFTVAEYPYDQNPFEQILGFVDADGRVKESGQGFKDALPILKTYTSWDKPAAKVGIYIPENYFRGNATMQYNVSHFYCHYLLTRLHVDHEFCREFDPKYEVMFIPSPGLWISEARKCTDYVLDGGKVIASGIDAGFWGQDWQDLCGVKAVDMQLLEGKQNFTCGSWNQQLVLNNMDGYIPELDPGTAKVIGFLGEEKFPGVIDNQYGKGRIICLLPPWEKLLMNEPCRLTAHQFYQDLVGEIGFQAEITCDQPDVEIGVLTNPENGEKAIIAVNHGYSELKTTITVAGFTKTVQIAGKSSKVMKMP